MENDQTLVKLPSYYVGIGASAGGLEAIETFFTHMPPDSGFGFIVVQHLSPDYKSLMVELLSKKTEMPVYRAENGMSVLANAVYLIPPKKNLTIFHGKLMLSEQDSSRGINLPIDVFLRSLAEDQGEKAIAVILSGTGSDGMRGVRAVKEFGGMIMVQNEESARFDGMPRAAVSTGLADFVLPPQEMPKQLMSFAKHPYAKAGQNEALLADGDALTHIFAILQDKSKVDFTYYKPNTVTRRIERRMTINQITDIRDYANYLNTYPGEIMSLYRELLIGVTSFFRDPEVFEELENKWMPEILKSSDSQELRFWVPGCSTGEEAYTLAIITREVMEKLDLSKDVKIFATDIDRDAIQVASAGLYPESITADLSPRIFSKYFYKKEEYLQIARNIREMIVFAQHNLIKDPPFTNIDLLSCRNLLIYLQPMLQRKVMEFFNFSLKPGRILLLGTSETTGEMSDYFEILNQKYKVYRSKGRLKQVLDGDSYQPNIFPGARRQTGGTFITASSKQMYRSQAEDKLLERFIQGLVGDYVPLSIVVNESLEVLHILGDTEGYFKLPSGRVVNDISKMATKDLAIPLATGIQKVFRTGQDLVYSNVHLSSLGNTRNINLRIKMLPQKKGQEPLAVVFISEAYRDNAESDLSVSADYDLSKDAEQHLKDLEQELQFTRENLQATIEELETANEELQATNEELLASNEELQSTNEELQSTNEELHTVNTEYQHKIIELTELNNDLDNILANTQIGLLILDENLEIRRFSPRITNIFKVLENDVGRPITHISHYIKNFDPIPVLEEVIKTGKPTDCEIYTENGRWYLLRAVPYHINPKTFAGAVVSFVDISTVLETNRELNESRLKMASLFEASPLGLGFMKDRVLLQVNKRLCEMTQYRETELVGKNMRIFYPTEEDFEAVGRDKYSQIEKTGIGTLETRWQRKDGSIIDVLLTLAPITKGKTQEGVSFTVLDITERKKNEEDLKKTHSRLDYIFKAAGLAWWDWNVVTGIVTTSPRKPEMAGYTPEETGSNLDFWISRIHPEDYDSTMQAMRDLLEGRCKQYHALYRLRKKDGTYIKFRDLGEILERDSNDRPIRVVGTVSWADL